MLRYPKGPPPKILATWQATPDASWESLPKSDKDEVREALLRDQGCLCAYCERRIPTRDEPMKIEHWRAQSGGVGVLSWKNLLGVCLGDESVQTGVPRGERHCDTARGDAPLFLAPVEGLGPSPREHLTYTSEGEVCAKDRPGKAAVSADIRALNLNAARLRRERRVVYEAVKERLEKHEFSSKALRDEHEAARVVPGTQALPQAEVVRYYVERWARKHDCVL